MYVNDGLTLDFIETDESFPIEHFCFRVVAGASSTRSSRASQAAGIAYRSNVRGAVDMKVNHQFGGSNVYWNEPDGHQWEMLTVSYARGAKRAAAERLRNADADCRDTRTLHRDGRTATSTPRRARSSTPPTSTMQENQEPPRRGRDAHVANEKPRARARPLGALAMRAAGVRAAATRS